MDTLPTSAKPVSPAGGVNLPRLLRRAAYRVAQFWLAWRAHISPAELDAARHMLSPGLFALFARLQPGEQAHSLAVLRQLQAAGQTAPELPAAALLHDIGKIQRPLRLWERAWIVLAFALLPAQADRWGKTQKDLERLPFWQQPLVVAVQHPAWGAALAASAGAPPQVSALIAHHQDKDLSAAALSAEDLALLAALQSVDDNN